MNNNRQHMILFGVLGVVLIALIVVSLTYVILPSKQTLKQEQANVAQSERLLDALLVKKEEQDSSEEVSWEEENKALLKNDLTALPVQFQLQQIFSEIEKADEASDVTLKSVRFTRIIGQDTVVPMQMLNSAGIPTTGDAAVEAEEVERGFGFENLVELQMDVEIELENYYNLRDFLEKIENANRKMTIYGVSFEGQEEVYDFENIDDEPLSATITMATYFARSEERRVGKEC